jgi:hypothetical protein
MKTDIAFKAIPFKTYGVGLPITKQGISKRKEYFAKTESYLWVHIRYSVDLFSSSIRGKINSKGYYVELFAIYKTVYDSIFIIMIEEKVSKKNDQEKNVYSETCEILKTVSSISFNTAVRAANYFTPEIGIPDLTIPHHSH